jgi:glutathione synthase/RimK-type ligase-like ATP-grasp enzyme
VIVAVSHPGDDHLAPVLATLRDLGEETLVLDTAEFPARARIALAYGGRRRAATLHAPTGRLDAARVAAVWWRRPRPLAAAAGLRDGDAGVAIRQANEAICGLGATLDVRWVNDPWRESAAAHKPLQLHLAERAGLRVPRTLVTNDPQHAREYLGSVGRRRVVHKALHSTPEDWRTTRILTRRDLAQLRTLRLAPVILQEYVPGVDVRVTAAGGKLFAAAIDARRTASPEDFRPVFDAARVEACALPREVAARLRKLLRALGLAYAAIDLRRRDDGEHVFLEANPSGQWLFVERRTGLPITAAVATLLAGR